MTGAKPMIIDNTHPAGRRPRPSGQGLTTLLVGVIAIAALYLGASIFVPLVLAVLLTFALSPVVRLLQRVGLPHLPAVLVTVAAAAALIICVSYLVITEVAHLATELPKYQEVVAGKLRALQASTTSGDLFQRLGSALQNILAALPEPVGAVAPQPVTIVDPAQGPLGFGQAFLRAVLGPLATGAIVTLFVIFLLAERENFRDRFLKLVSRGDLRTTTRAMTDAGRRVSRYLLVQFLVNATYGTLFGLGLSVIGIPDALLWGLLAALFRYIPFVGTIIAAIIPLALSFAIDPQWTKLVAVVALFVSLEMTITNAVEPRLYGSSTGLSTLAVLVAAMFWATIWGPIGLILATPVTVCLVVLGRYVPQLAFLETLLGSEPVLAREEQLYQRLVSGNTEEAIELAEQYVEKKGSPQAFYDDIAVPALRFAENDRAKDSGDLAERRLVAEGMDAVVREVESLWPEPAPETATPLTVLCIGGRTELDGAAASIIAQTIARRGVTVQVLPPVSLRPQGIGQIDLREADVICIAYLDAAARTYLRFAARHIRRRDPDISIIACLLADRETLGAVADMALPEGTTIATSIAAVDTLIAAMLTTDSPPDAAGAPPIADHQPLIRPGPALDDFTARVAREFGVTIAVVAMADTPSDTAGDASSPRSDLAPLRDHIIETGSALVIDASSGSAELIENSFLVENGFGFVAGAPILFEGQIHGVLLVFDQAGRTFTEADLARLQEFASEVAGATPTPNPTPLPVPPAPDLASTVKA
ncbi:AI-2E family transporter [Devosia sp.]|uniref:AI-2E family transporter n=1 Tax=Devosia sp. TaxID=1871048 RepID=UPI00262301F9|nr:AI-2E family transporter [Devosia sp.]